MKIYSIEEIPLGLDPILANELSSRRLSAGVTLAQVANDIGADEAELALIEEGYIRGFHNFERMRWVLIAYCDYLGVNSAPITARLEPYCGAGIGMVPNLFAVNDGYIAPVGRSLAVAVAAGMMALLLIAWIVMS